MHVPATLATLVLCIAAIVLVRLRWSRLSGGKKRLLLYLAVTCILVVMPLRAVKISITSDRANAALYWAAVLSYLFLLVLFTLLKPRWLSSLIAIVLFLPMLSASVFLPLATIYSSLQHHVSPLGDGFVSDLIPIDAVTRGASGADLYINRPISWAPFLQKTYKSVRYLNTQCDSSSAYAILLPGHRSVLFVCPAAQGYPPGDARTIVLPLYSDK